jgi:hypothetical protein
MTYLVPEYQWSASSTGLVRHIFRRGECKSLCWRWERLNPDNDAFGVYDADDPFMKGRDCMTCVKKMCRAIERKHG